MKMFTDGKIKKALRKSMQPTKTFDEFCAENGIVIEKPNVKRRKVFAWKKLVFPLAAAAAALCVVLPVALTRGGNGGGASLPSESKQYNVGNEVTKLVDFSELKSDPDLVLYNTAYEQSNSYSAFLCSEDDGVLLAYIVKSVVYGGQVDGTLHAYTFDFLARCYDGYAETYTLVLDWYKQNGAAYNSGGVDYYYGTVSGADGASAVICYENGKYDYFVRMRLLNVGSTIGDNSVRNFIDLAFGDPEEE